MRFQLSSKEATEDGGLTATEIVLAVGLFFLMIGVGASCKPKLFRKIAKSPRALKAALVGVSCQYVFMPLISYILTLIFQIDGFTAFGVVLAGCMPGGSSSNVFTMWAQGVLELSVFMTVFSTVIGFGMVPLWLFAFTNLIDGVESSSFSFMDLIITLALLVIPLSIGFGLNFIPCLKKVNYEKPITVLAVIIFIAAVIMLAVEYPDSLKLYATWEVVIAAAILFPIAASLSYGIMTLLKFSSAVRRTVCMEVGLQNLALGYTIGQQMVKGEEEKNQALPFPIIYTMFMYFYGFVLVPVMRRQKRRNEDNGIEDSDPAFFLEEEVVPLEESKGGKHKTQEHFEDEQNVEEMDIEKQVTVQAAEHQESQ